MEFGTSATDFRPVFYKDVLMNNNKISNVGAPVSNNDAATKDYADSKVSKSGDVMTGDLVLSAGTANVRLFGCNNLTGVQGFNIYLGSFTNLILCAIGQPIMMLTDNGFLVKCNTNNVVKFGTSASDLRTNFYQDVVMNNNYIANLRHPNTAQDAATKNYVDQRVLKTGDSMTGTLNMNGTNMGLFSLTACIRI
jgi:hypothetical protein